MIVLVTGDRNWDDRELLYETLDRIGPQNIDYLVEGCARGADQMASDWAIDRGVEVHHHPAEWEVFGRAAGPMRNVEMLGERPDLVVAFHHDLSKSKGTAHMVKIAKKAEIPVEIIE